MMMGSTNLKSLKAREKIQTDVNHPSSLTEKGHATLHAVELCAQWACSATVN